ncbi:MadC family VWA domain-containing protein [Antrihabitans cavernicola]|uniref:VWA domain-containing protein n=1 Tax=Antrihabitans cavernicola TaxID=2495913 RepID=A0A5A7S6N3_9NOCA|nr:VWA domain-containing protein [Spelaeibacter cavernicola]KAA0020013.1 VWA domain-containing protein [Spelaeibacter cavernicola]
MDRPGLILDLIAASFGGVLRSTGVAASPAEVIEVRRVLGLLGARDHDVLRAALRATCAKYAHEQAGFDRAFDAMFVRRGEAAPPSQDRVGSSARASQGLPDDLAISEDQEIGRYAEYNERAAEVGEFFDTEEAAKGFNPHKDDDDISVSGSDADLTVSAENDSGRRGVTYTLEVDRAGTTAVGDLSDSMVPIVAGSLSWDDPASILAWLDAYDPNSTYVDTGDDEALTADQLARLTAAVETFVEALAATAAAVAPEPQLVGTESDLHADVDLACHEVLRRMRGARRPRPRENGRGTLDMRRTTRASLRTDGVPFRLIIKTPRPDRVRLLILADVSLSVRPVTAFTLRLAQAMHRRADRCRVMAFVDTPTEVTEVLLRGGGDNALGSVLACEQLDLEASSDYGHMLDEMLTTQADALDSRTAVLIVGDARSGGLPPKVEQLEALRRRVHRLAWITPEPRRYWTQATCAMTAYAEVCDRVVIARDAEQLAAKAAELADALS